MNKISDFPLNLTRMQQTHYFCDIQVNYYMLKKINRRPEGGGHRSMSTPLNTPLPTAIDLNMQQLLLRMGSTAAHKLQFKLSL